MKSAAKFISLILIVSFWLPTLAQSQEKGFNFTTIADIKTTPVKDQFKSGTCWSFATTSFVETELLRMNKGEYDLSEMYFARYAYEGKADKYVRRQGTANFGPGGQAHDVMNVIRQHGFVTNAAYTGFAAEPNHIHNEMDAALKAYVDVVKDKKNGHITPVWKDAFNALLDVYLGKLPTAFSVNNKSYDPVSFAKSTGFNPDDYIEITSYSHVPFYKKVMIDIPDNWSQDLYYNLPLDEMIEVIESALKNGYSVCWDGDVSDKGFSHKNGLAIAPESEPKSMEGTERARWENLSDTDRMAQLYSFSGPVPEKKVTQEVRQQAFDSQQTTDDHLMHITGMVKDQNGTVYFKTKNSWNSNSNKMGGYLNMSEPYIRINTIAVLVHKNAISKTILTKLGL
ncbi:MAG: C1 family peptidase [Bacteroidota bacterium]|nr:C1 family peptidase [Bacteroidota bacterium]